MLYGLPEDENRVIAGEMEDPEEANVLPLTPWHDSLLNLPGWMPVEDAEINQRTRPANHGAGLFPPQVWPQQPEPALGPLLLDIAPVIPAAPVVQSHPATPVALGPEIMALYVGAKPDRVLVDPQHLVPGDRVEPLVRRWLNEQCNFRTTILLFGPGQQLPADFDPQALRRLWFEGAGEALLVFYFRDQPERTLTIFGPEARDRYGADRLRSLVDAAVAEAGRVTGGLEQLERFCYKMSVRLHWLARHPLPSPPGGLKPAASAMPTLTGRGALWILVVLAAGAALYGGWRFKQRRIPSDLALSKREQPIFLPEFEFRPRFGAPHSGGFSSMITFAKQPQVKLDG